MKNTITLLFLFLLVIPIYGDDSGSSDFEKVFEESYNIGSNGRVKVNHRRGPLRVERINGSEAKIKVVLKAEKGTNESFQKLVDNFSLNAEHNGSNLSIDTDLNIRNYRSVNGRTTIEFKNGNKVKGLHEISVDFLLQIPKVSELELKNKYENIYLPNMEGDVTINLYSADLIAEDIQGNFELGIKYGKAKLGKVQNATLDIYDSRIEMGDAADLNLKSKYSKISMGNLAKAELNTYDDHIKLGNVQGDLNIKDKYGDFEIGNFQNGNWTIYDAVVKAGSTNTLKLVSKYTEYSFDEIKVLDATNVYDDEFSINQLGNLDCTSKYSEFDIDRLSGSVELTSYNDDFEVDRVLSGFKGLELTGKYAKIDLPIPSDMAYHLETKMKYGNVDYASERFEMNVYIEKSSNIEIKGKTKGASASAPVIKIKEAYDCKIDLE